eukprot:ANDGO_03381.mRNA.1 Arginase
MSNEVKKTVGLVGFPFSGGQRHGGVEKGPCVLRDPIQSILSHLGLCVTDLGDVDVDACSTHLNVNLPVVSKVDTSQAAANKAYQATQVASATCSLASSLVSALAKYDFVVTMGGDHSAGIGTLSAVLQHDPRTVVVWVDAHADINTLDCSPSGNMHGMPVSVVARLGSLPEAFKWLEHYPALNLSRIGYLGLRDVDAGERVILANHGVTAFSASDIEKVGIANAVQSVIDALDPSHTAPIHISFDIDGIDPMDAPATGTPVRGGITVREAKLAMEMLAQTGRVRSMDMVEVNPDLNWLGEPSKEAVDRTVGCAAEIVAAALGRSPL